VNLASVKEGDIVRCDVRGDRFYALAQSEVEHDGTRRGIQVDSLTGRPIPARFVTARQVVGHWRKSKASRV
jgi:hypothetical protein